MPFGILRIEKRKSGELVKRSNHDLRQKKENGELKSKSNPDIDLRKIGNNRYKIPSIGAAGWVKQEVVDEGLTEKSIRDIVFGRIKAAEDELKHITKGKIKKIRLRKDTTYVIDCVITASPEFQEGRGDFLEMAYKYVVDKFGEANLVYAAFHNDETSPHLHVWFVPLTGDFRMCAKDFLGGPKDMHKMQEDFYEKVCKPFGLDHHAEYSKGEPRRKHIEMSEYKRFKEDQKVLFLKRQQQKIRQDLYEAEKKQKEALAEAEELFYLIAGVKESNLIEALKRVDRFVNDKQKMALIDQKQREYLLSIQATMKGQAEHAISQLNNTVRF